jgi:uncharacterized membrane protein (UPF0136 family)
MTMGRFWHIEGAMFEFAQIYLYVFGALTIVGGVIGFVKAGSKASLIAGGISGVLLLVAGWLTASKPTAGLVLGLILSLLLAGRFVPAFLKTKKPMPAGMMSVLSIVGLVVTALALFSHH